jgi:hypothetical protein
MNEIEAIKFMKLFREEWDKNSKTENSKALDMAIQALEKQIPMRPVHDGCFDSEGMWHEWNGVNGRPYDLCPNCNTNLCCEMPCDNKPKYCKHCGQRLDWSDEE